MDTPCIAITGIKTGRDALEGLAVDLMNAATTAATCETKFVSTDLRVVTNLLGNATGNTQGTEMSGARVMTGGTNVSKDARTVASIIAKEMTTGSD
jgi:hypothetical protein